MRKLPVSLLVALMLSACLFPAVAHALQPAGPAPAHEQPALDIASAGKSLKAAIQSEAGNPVRYFRYLNAAMTRAVAITASYVEDSMNVYKDGEVWYADANGVQFLYSSDGLGVSSSRASTKLYSVKNGKLFVVEDATYISSGKSVAWFIGQGKVRQLPDVGGNLTRTGSNQFVAYHSAYDPAHSWKNYYFHWDGKRIVEYGGKKMSVNQLKRARNGVRVIKAIRHKLGAITTIYYRSNGIINVNYKENRGRVALYGNVTLKYRSGKVSYAKVNSYGKNTLELARDIGVYKKRNPDNVGTVRVEYPKRLPAKLAASK